MKINRERKKIAEHGDTCGICGYVYEEGEEIHPHKSNSQKLSGELPR